MAKRVSVLNGTNNTQDYDILQWHTSQLPEGVLSSTGLLVQAQSVPDDTVKISAGVCLIEVTRTADGKTFKIFGELTAEQNLTVLDTATHPTWIGAVVAVIDKSKVQDGSANPENGTGVFDLQYIAGTSTSPLSDGAITTAIGTSYEWIRLANVTQDPTVASGDISDQRVIVGVQQVLTENNVALRAKNSTGTILSILKLLNSSNVPEFQVHPRTFAGRSIANNQDLIDLEYFLANVPVGGTVNLTLGENLTAQDLVRIYNNGGTATIKKLLADAIGSAQQVTTHTGFSNMDVCAIDTNKIVVVYELTNAVYAVCCTISGTTLTVGTRVTINSSTVSNFPTVCKLDTNKFVVGFRYYDGATQHASSKACTVSGTTITVGSAVDAKSGYNGSVKVIQLGTDKFVGVYGSGSSGTWADASAVYGRVATVSGTTITYGTEQTLIASVTGISAIDGAVRVADDKFYVVSNSDVLYCTVSGTVITANARTAIATKITGTPKIGLNTTTFLIYETGYIHSYSHDGAGTETFINTQAITFVVQQIIPLETDGKYILLDNTNSGFRKAWMENGTVNYARCYIPSGANISASYRLCQFGSTTLDQFFYFMGNGYGLIGTANDNEDFAGIIQETGVTSDSKPVAVKGAISDIHSFADADVGKTVYIQEAGGLGTTMTSFPIGKVYDNAYMVIKD